MERRPHDAAAWISRLPPALDRHRVVLQRLLTVTRGDERIRMLVVGCSIGRGVADEHSDIDACIGVRPDNWSAYLDEIPKVVGRLGSVVDLFHERISPPDKDPYQLTWVLYEDGVLLELVVGQAPSEARPPGDWVVLHDPDGRVKEQRGDRHATSEEVREWAYKGWSSLLLCAKYVTRGSLWEALETLHFARTQAWRLWAAAQRIPDPQYGLTAILNSEDDSPPPGIEATHARLERSELARAALACVELLNALWPRATSAVMGSPTPVPAAGTWARRRLAEVIAAL